MQRLFKFVEGEIRGLHEAAYLLGFFAVLSTVLALFRDRLLAATFGASELLDVYYAAFRIPDLVYISIASMVSVFILVPILNELDTQEKRYAFLGNVILGFSLAMLIVSVVVWFLLPSVLPKFFPLLWEDSGGILLTLSRALLLQPFFLGLSGIMASIVQAHGRFMLYAIAPLLYNASIIVGIVALYPLFGLEGIVYGVVLGALLHLLIQVPFVFRQGYMRKNTFRIDVSQLIHVVSVSVPRTLSMSSTHFALLILVALAATLGVGAISVFSLAFNLQAAPLAVIGASYSVAAFPTLARHFAHGEIEHFCNQLIAASRHIIFWSVPILSLTIVLRTHIVRVVLGSGSFDWADTRLTAAALALFLMSLTAQALSLLFVRGYYAAGETVKPLIVNVLTAIGMVGGAFAFTYAFNEYQVWRFFFEELFRVEGIPGTVVLMLPLSYALFSVLNVCVFFMLFVKDFGLSVWRSLERTIFESFSAAVVAGFFAHQTLRLMSDSLDINTFWGVFLLGLSAGLIGIVAGVVVLYVLDSREIKEVWATIHTRFWKHAPILGSWLSRPEK